jgi:hypothetical protein
MAQAAEGSPVVAHGHHGAGVILDPADEEGSGQNPDQGRQPAPLDGDYGAYDGRRAGDGFELIAKKDVLAGGHELHAVHVHLGRCRLFGVSLDYFGINVAGVKPVSDKVNHKTQDQHYYGIHDFCPPSSEL